MNGWVQRGWEGATSCACTTGKRGIAMDEAANGLEDAV